MSLRGRTAFITGASRRIGLEIGKALARKGANVAVAAKTSEPHPKLPGTIDTAAEENTRIGEENGTGAKGLAIQLDIRDTQATEEAIEKTVGNLNIVVNNASAINMKPIIESSVKSLLIELTWKPVLPPTEQNSINSRGTWLVSRFALPHLLKSSAAGRNPHILTLSPPLHYNMLSTDPKYGTFPAQFVTTASTYAIAKMGMSLATLALAAELQGKVGFNALWPYTLIRTSTMKIVSCNADTEKKWRSPEIVSEAAIRVLENGSKFNAQFLVDEIYLRRDHGFTDEQIAEFSLEGPQTKMEDLAEHLYISQELREDV